MGFTWDLIQSTQIYTLQGQVSELERQVAALQQQLGGTTPAAPSASWMTRADRQLADIERRLDALEGRRGKRLID